jgi:hypothetical protein
LGRWRYDRGTFGDPAGLSVDRSTLLEVDLDKGEAEPAAEAQQQAEPAEAKDDSTAK